MRVVQWNVSYTEPVAAVANVLADLQPDICLLQEVTADYQQIDVAAELGRLLGMAVYVEYGVNQLPDGSVARMGNAILSRWGLRDQRSVMLQPARTEQGRLIQSERRYVEAQTDTPFGSVTLGTAHWLFSPKLGSTPGKRAMAAQMAVERPVAGPYILALDANATPGSRVIRQLRLDYVGQVQARLSRAGRSRRLRLAHGITAN